MTTMLCFQVLNGAQGFDKTSWNCTALLSCKITTQLNNYIFR